MKQPKREKSGQGESNSLKREGSGVKQIKKGSLYYLIGASGVGKDSLLNYVRPLLTKRADHPVLIAHRYITRPVELTGENHIQLSEAEFLMRQQHDCFLFTWQSHDLYYGIGQEVADWLAKGINVVINGSRGYLKQATHIWPEIKPILVTVSLDKLQQRLEARGRENAAQIQERLQRAAAFSQLTHPNLFTVSNDGSLEEGGEKLYQLLVAE
ncbi:Ribose 1,5-bisphosphate phosphokinase PhnN [hydrothermal vent metagenome]|uniref:Ribose 1,5-bisphosphate phosphokinase PhnN n=1 Tax=hydrothermal vent metagenome TaxID=652676 RepID=A0A3B0WB47_9ZZZZ